MYRHSCTRGLESDHVSTPKDPGDVALFSLLAVIKVFLTPFYKSRSLSPHLPEGHIFMLTVSFDFPFTQSYLLFGFLSIPLFYLSMLFFYNPLFAVHFSSPCIFFFVGGPLRIRGDDEVLLRQGRRPIDIYILNFLFFL